MRLSRLRSAVHPWHSVRPLHGNHHLELLQVVQERVLELLRCRQHRLVLLVLLVLLMVVLLLVMLLVMLVHEQLERWRWKILRGRDDQGSN